MLLDPMVTVVNALEVAELLDALVLLETIVEGGNSRVKSHEVLKLLRFLFFLAQFLNFDLLLIIFVSSDS